MHLKSLESGEELSKGGICIRNHEIILLSPGDNQNRKKILRR